MQTLAWSSDLPSVDGFYWLRRPGRNDTIVRVWDVKSGLMGLGAQVSWPGSDEDSDLKRYSTGDVCLWKGPLTPDDPA